MLFRSNTKRVAPIAGVSLILYVLAAVLNSPASATSMSIGPSSMEGHLDARPGQWISAGYSITIPGSHPDATVGVHRATVTLPVRCADNGSSVGNIVIALAERQYTVPANSSAWYPSGDQDRSESYQGAVVAPDLCGGGILHLNYGRVVRSHFQRRSPLEIGRASCRERV